MTVGSYYFDAYDTVTEKWELDPANMVDGDVDTFAGSDTSYEVQALTSNNYTSGGTGSITNVYIRAYGNVNDLDPNVFLYLRPVFSAGDGDNHDVANDFRNVTYRWSDWVEITSDSNAPSSWTWDDIASLKCDIEGIYPGAFDCAEISKVEIKVISIISNNFNISQTPGSQNLILYPNGDITSNLTPYGETNNYECVDDTSGNYNEDTDYVYTDSIAEIEDIYSLPDHTTETGSINYVEVFSRCKSHNLSQSPSGVYKILITMTPPSATLYSDDIDIMQGYHTYSKVWTTTPGGTVWTWDAVDDMRIGISCNSPTLTGVSLQQILRPDGAGYIYEMYGYLKDNYSLKPATSSNYTHVYEEEYDDSDSYLYAWSPSGSGSQIDSFTASGTYDNGVIDSAVLFYRGKTQSSLTSKVFIRLNGTNYYATSRDMDYNWSTYSYQWSLNPDTSLTWEIADFNNIEMGMYANYLGNSGTNPSLTQMYLVINYHKNYNPEIRTTQVYAVVNYNPPSTNVELTKPKNISYGHGHNIGKFNFPDGSYRVSDFGVSYKTVTLSGTQVTDAVSKTQSVKDMSRYGDKVTLSGFDDGSLNDDFIIRSFKRTYNGLNTSGDIVYNWELVLEKTD